MERIKDIVISVYEDIEAGELTYSLIAEKYNVTLEMVRGIAVDYIDQYNQYNDTK